EGSKLGPVRALLRPVRTAAIWAAAGIGATEPRTRVVAGRYLGGVRTASRPSPSENDPRGWVRHFDPEPVTATLDIEFLWQARLLRQSIRPDVLARHCTGPSLLAT